MWQTPEDCTAVVRVLREFDKIAGPHQTNVDPKGRLNFEETPSPLSTSQFNRSRKTTEAQLSRKRSADREKDVELFCAKGRIAQLENEKSLLRTESKRSKIEQQKEVDSRQGELRRQIEKNADLQQQLKYVVNEEKKTKEELKNTKKEFEDHKIKCEEKIHSLQRQKLKINSETEESKVVYQKLVSELKEKLTRQEAENIICQNKLEDTENQLGFYKKRYNDASEQINDLEEFRGKYLAAEHKTKDLEEKLCRQQEAADVAMTMQSQVAKYYEVECENSKLKEHNAYLKATNKSNLLLKEKLQSAQSKLKRAEEKLKDLSKVEVEYEKQKSLLKKWESSDNANNIRSPSDMVQEIARLQQAQVVLLQKQTEAATSARISSDALKSQSKELVELKIKCSQLEEENSEVNEQLKRVNKLLSLVVTERNGCRRLLNSYDSGDTTNSAPQLSSRVQQTEEQLKSCNAHIEQLESDLKASIEKASEQVKKYNKLKIAYDQLNTNQQIDDKVTNNGQKLKEEMTQLKEENQELQQKVNVLELRIEQRNLQGDYDPSKVKVVHFSHNPFVEARKSRSEEMQALKDDNENLRKKLKLLQEESEGTKSSNIEHVIIDEMSPADVKDLQAQVSSGERKMQRLKEVFSQKIQEFREACYSLTGYRVDAVKDQQYRLKSMYAERSTDSLLFQVNANGKIMLLETDFSLQLKDLIDNYLMRCNSIPAFLSSVTLELFERQTQMLH